MIFQHLNVLVLLNPYRGSWWATAQLANQKIALHLATKKVARLGDLRDRIREFVPIVSLCFVETHLTHQLCNKLVLQGKEGFVFVVLTAMSWGVCITGEEWNP